MTQNKLSRITLTTLTVALVAAACGGGQADTLSAVAEQPTATAAEAEPEVPSSGQPQSAQEPEAESAEPGNAEAEQTTPAQSPAEPNEPTAEPANNELPDVDVIDLGTGTEINLRTLAPAETPIILWFWAPY